MKPAQQEPVVGDPKPNDSKENRTAAGKDEQQKLSWEEDRKRYMKDMAFTD